MSMEKNIYLDNAATSFPKPQEVQQGICDACSSMSSPGRGAYGSALEAGRTVFRARRAMANLLNAESSDCIAFTSNATEALNIALQGVLTSGEHVITTVMEHNSVLRPLYMLEARGVELSLLPVDDAGVLRYDLLEGCLRKNSRALVVTHASNVTGNVNNLALLGAFAKSHGLLFIVDAAQTAGALPIDVQEMGIDILCFTGHKSLLGPQGTGGLYVRSGVQVRPLKVGGSGVHSFDREHPQAMPTALEAGTLNVPGICGLERALELLSEDGRMQEIYEHDMLLARRFLEGVRNIKGVRLYGNLEAAVRVPIISLNIGGADSALVSDSLWEEYAICTRPGAHCAPLMHRALGTEKQGVVRFSFGYANTLDEVKIAVEAVRKIAEETKL